MDSQKTFDILSAKNWNVVFNHKGHEDWRKNWVLDGLKATITPTERGMVFEAGPIAGDHACHAVLWTKEKFSGDLKIEFDFTRLDTINRFVNILYIQANGVGDYPEDIHLWREQRDIPYMETYFNHMDLLHISYAAFGNDDDEFADYIRVRKYPIRPDFDFQKTEVEPSHFKTGFFHPGVTYHMCFIKTDNRLALKIEGEEETQVFAWDLSSVDPVDNGPIGIRHMFSKCSRYKNFTISRAD